jgi:hypothetical protein
MRNLSVPDQDVAEAVAPFISRYFPFPSGHEWEAMPELLQTRDAAISIYLALDPDNRDVRQPDVRLRKLFDEAIDRLNTSGLPENARAAIIDPASRFIAGLDFTRFRPGSLVMLFAADMIRALELPCRGESQVVAGRHFHIKPTLNLVEHNKRFYLLALSRGKVALWSTTPFHWQPMPLDLANESLRAELDSRLAADQTPAASEELRQSLLLEDPQRVAAAVRAAIGGDKAPIVLAGDPRVTGHFIKVAHNDQILPDTLSLNPFGLDEGTLHRRAVELIVPSLDSERDAFLELARSRLGTAEASVAIRLDEILLAAHEGRVDSVAVADDQAIWGHFRPGEAPDAHGTPHGLEDDLLNLAAVLTLRAGGRAFSLPTEQIPRRSPAIATLRF